ncbi:MAG TPA: carboxypeptidase regulatory-like domain-containing protein [Terracidiphilus sp.]|nr:carboxypeptidase regulatory-like domain-containing protein [Terracidiphilus sp.]
MTQHLTHRSPAVHRSLAATCLLILALGVAFALPVSAQRYLGGITGQITDSTGAKVVGAKVTAVEGATHYSTTVTTGADGTYLMPALQPGTYSVTVTAPGFRQEERTNVVITAGQTVQQDMALTPGAVTATIQVTAETNSLIDTSSPDLATTLNTQAVTDLPNNGRNPYVMVTLAPGVISTTGNYFQAKSSQYTNPYSGTAVAVITDGISGHTRLTLDGIPVDAAERFSGASYTGFVPSPEAVQEVKVENGIFDAQIGHGDGSVTNAVVRSGKNTLHGSAYYVFQNTYLDANTYEKAGLGQARSNNQVNQTGLVIDGPVYIPKLYDGRNKTYFMFSFERYATHTPQPYSTRVPTADELKGDFSGLCSSFNSSGLCTTGVQLYVPNSPVDANGNRTEYYAYNNIAAAMNATGQAFATYLPGPNVSGSTALTNPNYISQQTSYPATYPSFIGRFDQVIGKNDKVSVIGFRSGLTQSFPLEGFPKGIGPTNSSTGYGYSVYRNNRGGSMDEVHQFSSTMVLDSRLGLDYHPFGLVYPGNTNFNLSALGIATTGLPYNTFPGEYMNSDGYAGLAPGAGGQVSTDVLGAWEEILSKEWGRHFVRFGFEGNMSRYNVQNPQSGFGINAQSGAGFVFDRRFTQQNVNAPVGSEATSGDPMASMLLGYFSTANYDITIAYAMQQIYTAPFVQDDWRVNDKLTLNLGARWDYESPMTERYNRMNTNFCTTCTNPLQSSVSGLTLNGGLQFVNSGDRLPYPRDLGAWQPRLGAEYAVNSNTVVRAGFGIIYFNTLESPFSSGYSQATSYTNTSDGIHPINSMTNPYPSGVTLPSGNTLGLATAIGQNINFNDQHHVQPRSAEYTVSVQQQFAGNFAMQIAYVGADPTHLDVNHNINFLPAQYYNLGAAEVTYLNNKVANPMAGLIPNNATLNGATIQQYLLLQPYPEFGTVTANYSSIGSSPYNSLQIQVSKPMNRHFTVQGNFTWDKVMNHTQYLNPFDTRLASIQDSNSTILANIFGTVEFPKFQNLNYAERLILGGWQFNSVFRAANGPLVSAPSNVNIIGPVEQGHATDARYFNTCYENTSGQLVMSTASAPACDSLSSVPAYQQRLSYTSQYNSTVIGVRQRIHPLVDASLFKRFTLGEGKSFEIRGEFFNVLNTPNFGGPGTSIGSSTFGVVTLTQANDPRLGQLTARLNF